MALGITMQFDLSTGLFYKSVLRFILGLCLRIVSSYVYGGN